MMVLFRTNNSIASNASPEGMVHRLEQYSQKRSDTGRSSSREDSMAHPAGNEDGSNYDESGETQQHDGDTDGNPQDSVSHGGTHTTKTGYFNDFEYERANPSFRRSSVTGWEENENTVSSLLNDKPSLRSCQYLSDTHQRLFRSDTCKREGGEGIVAYNNQPFPRFWCGVEIGPHSAVKIDQPCTQPIRLFPSDPPVDGQGYQPVVIKDSPEAIADRSNLETVQCDIPCERVKKPQGNLRYIEGTSWRILQTMDDPVKRPDEKVERNAYRQDQYYSTTSFSSSVPLTEFSFDKYDIFAPAVDYDTVESTGSYFIDSQCASQALHRNRWEDAIHRQAPVASYGSCAHNAEMPEGLSLKNQQDRIAQMKKHRFNVAFEYGDAKDHITSVVWEAFSSGSLPVVLGAQNVADHFPPNSFISNVACQRWDDLGAKVKAIVNDKEKWESYQAWRTDPEAKQFFETKYNFTRTSPDCRMCRWAYAKRYGHGWNHVNQSVRSTAIERTLCLDSNGLAVKPFLESWFITSDHGNDETILAADADNANCQTQPIGPVSLKGGGFREFQIHDNVFDLVVTDLKPLSAGQTSMVLRLELPMLNTDGAHFRDAHTLISTTRGSIVSSIAFQDKKSKVAILADWETEIQSVKEGVVDVVVVSDHDKLHHGKDEVRRIRIIIEDKAELYDKVTEYWPSSFTQQMIQDFVDPLELYYTEK